MQAAAAPPWPGTAQASAWPGSWSGAIGLLSGGLFSIGPVRQTLHRKPMPVATLKAPVPTMNRYDALGEHIGPESAPESARMNTSEEFPPAIFLEADQAEKEKEGETILPSSTCSTSAEQLPERSGELLKRQFHPLLLPCPLRGELASHMNHANALIYSYPITWALTLKIANWHVC